MRRYRIRVLARGNADFPRAGLDVEGAEKLLCTLEKAEGMRQEATARVGQHGGSPGAAALSVQLDPQALFERQEPVSQALFGNPEYGRRCTDLAVARQLDERADLIRAESGNVAHASHRNLDDRTNK